MASLRKRKTAIRSAKAAKKKAARRKINAKKLAKAKECPDTVLLY